VPVEITNREVGQVAVLQRDLKHPPRLSYAVLFTLKHGEETDHQFWSGTG